MMNIKTLLFILILFSCKSSKKEKGIEWIESNAICVHWSDVAKERYDTKAIHIVLRSNDPKNLDSSSFIFRTSILRMGVQISTKKDTSFLLGKIEKIKREGDNYFLFLFIRSEDLYDLFPEGENYYNDNCYHIELANMIGQGEVIMEDSKNEIKIGKSESYSFHIGPK